MADLTRRLVLERLAGAAALSGAAILPEVVKAAAPTASDALSELRPLWLQYNAAERALNATVKAVDYDINRMSADTIKSFLDGTDGNRRAYDDLRRRCAEIPAATVADIDLKLAVLRGRHKNALAESIRADVARVMGGARA